MPRKSARRGDSGATTSFSHFLGRALDPVDIGTPKGIDVRDLLITGQSAPKTNFPPELNDAIDRRAVELAQEAFALCREHLQRRVAHACEYGHPQRELLLTKAFAVVSDGSLGDALTVEWRRKMFDIQRYARIAVREANSFLNGMNAALDDAEEIE